MFVDIAVWLIESKDLIQNWNSYSEQDNHNNHIISMGAIDLCYCQTSNISHTLVGNKIVDHSDVVGAFLI